MPTIIIHFCQGCLRVEAPLQVLAVIGSRRLLYANQYYQWCKKIAGYEYFYNQEVLITMVGTLVVTFAAVIPQTLFPPVEAENNYCGNDSHDQQGNNNATQFFIFITSGVGWEED